MRIALALLLCVPVFAQDAGGKWKDRYPTRTRKADPAVQKALLWLARHQSPSGAWSARAFSAGCTGGKCSGAVENDFDVGLTGLSLLALMGAGYGPLAQEEVDDPVTGKKVLFGESVHRGLQYLMEHQDQEGGFGERTTKYLYGHMIAAWALFEAYGMTGSPFLKQTAQPAFDFVVASQNAGQGWRYHPRSGDSDTSVTGWAVMALWAGELADLGKAKNAHAGALAWLDQATEQKGFYQVGYNARSTGKVFVPGKNEQFDHHATMTAIGVVTRLFIQKNRGDAALKGINLMADDLPQWKGNKTDLYYWYWGALAVFQMDGPQGPLWKKWSDALKTALGPTQRTAKDGCLDGSWDPDQERWGSEGGRIYTTALGALILETPYRLPAIAPDNAPKKK